MQTACEEKARAYAYLDGIAERLYAHAMTVRGTPELGFKEEKTSAYVEEQMRALGLFNVRRVPQRRCGTAVPPRRTRLCRLANTR